jgi:hypothetical protein
MTVLVVNLSERELYYLLKRSVGTAPARGACVFICINNIFILQIYICTHIIYTYIRIIHYKLFSVIFL